MKKMIATSNIEYPPGNHFKPGDPFDVADEHVELLRTLGRAKLPEGAPVSRDMQAAPAAEYQTRDMGTLHLSRRNRKAA